MTLPAAVRRHRAWWVGMAVVVVGVLVFAGGRAPDEGTGDERLYALAGQLKCLQCVGESVAASQAPLAEQFRDEIRAQMATGASDDEILAFFVDRYGDQVLLEPPTTGLSALVWVLPVLVVGAAVVGLGFAFGRWRSTAGGVGGPAPDSDPGSGKGGAVAPGRADAASSAPGHDDVEVSDTGSPGWRVPAVIGAVVVFGGLTAWLVVSGSGDRGEGELSGGTGSIATDLARCQPLAMRDPAAAIDCYDAVLAAFPDNLEALTYRGWAHVRADEETTGVEDLTRVVDLDPTYPDARVFLAVVAADNGNFAGAAEELAAFWANDPSDAAVSVVQAEGLDRKVFFGLMSAATRACWQRAAEDGEDGAIDQAFLDGLGICLDTVLAGDPTDADARLSRALAHIGPDRSDPAAARALLDGLVSEDPADSDALALRVSLDIATGEMDEAGRRLDTLEELPRGPAAFLIGDAATLRTAWSAARQESLPNPDGG